MSYLKCHCHQIFGSHFISPNENLHVQILKSAIRLQMTYKSEYKKRNIKRSVYCQLALGQLALGFLSDEGPMLETLDYTIRIGSISTFLYFDLYLYSAYAAHFVYWNIKRSVYCQYGYCLTFRALALRQRETKASLLRAQLCFSLTKGQCSKR